MYIHARIRKYVTWGADWASPPPLNLIGLKTKSKLCTNSQLQVSFSNKFVLFLKGGNILRFCSDVIKELREFIGHSSLNLKSVHLTPSLSIFRCPSLFSFPFLFCASGKSYSQAGLASFLWTVCMDPFSLDEILDPHLKQSQCQGRMIRWRTLISVSGEQCRGASHTLSVLVPATFLYPVRTRLASPLISSAPNSASQNTATPSTHRTKNAAISR